MGLSHNKVAVSEGAAGSPPFKEYNLSRQFKTECGWSNPTEKMYNALRTKLVRRNATTRKRLRRPAQNFKKYLLFD